MSIPLLYPLHRPLCIPADFPPAPVNPTAILARFQPPKLGSVASQLEFYQRTVGALRLLARYFPHAADLYQSISQPVWWEILIQILTLSENESWFKIDWDNIYHLLKLWESRNADSGKMLANYLHYIPLRFYGFSPALIGQFPPVELLYILLTKDTEVRRTSADLLITLEIYDQFQEQWTGTERQAAWRRLHDVEQNPDPYPDIVRHLPILARWACRMTGNPILDYPPPHWTDARMQIPLPYYFRWDDASLARMLWQRAKPVIDLLEPLMDWYGADPDHHLIELYLFLAEGELRLLEM